MLVSGKVLPRQNSFFLSKTNAEHFFHPKNVKTPGKHQQANKAHHKATKQKSLRLHIPISSAPRHDSVAPLTIRQYHSIGFMPTYRVRPWQVESVRPKTICDNASMLGTAHIDPPCCRGASTHLFLIIQIPLLHLSAAPCCSEAASNRQSFLIFQVSLPKGSKQDRDTNNHFHFYPAFALLQFFCHSHHCSTDLKSLPLYLLSS